MVKRNALVCALVLSTLVLGYAAFNPEPAKAGLWCSQLRGCKGQAGCEDGGSATGCTITCTGGGQSVCEKGDLELE